VVNEGRPDRGRAREIGTMPRRDNRKDQLQGTLDLLVLRTLSTGGSMHGYAIAERVEQVSREVLQIEAGSLYPALHRMAEAGWVRSEWDVSDHNRRARFYAITPAGRRRLAEEEEHWTRLTSAVGRVLRHA
jgi:PadR family transcriptional regulator, regulatory protein PadR